MWIPEHKQEQGHRHALVPKKFVQLDKLNYSSLRFLWSFSFREEQTFLLLLAMLGTRIFLEVFARYFVNFTFPRCTHGCDPCLFGR